MWTDTNRRQMKLPASQYIDYVMTYVQNLMDDESMFPTKSGNYLITLILLALQYIKPKIRFSKRLPAKFHSNY
jgi:hypothetical protein